MLQQSADPPKLILGYELSHRLGAGGYGEVWVAQAPGGLLKAIKLVFGCHDENRAQRELKSLNRIKEVRHPFLLSLERIEVVDGRLIVVTELAERSLKDRFLECIEQGKSGIPRDEMLGYIADAAEALDYLSETHGLQHLDVKPENLLLVGGHVKVADFGLVKDVHDGMQSLMTALTPVYAAPELFDGRPGRRSDQYSLAIVFQEMLTGTRPFPGKTAAQLATQHLHGQPALHALPTADQKTIRRALAKSPDARFSDCRSFVEDLKRRNIRRPIRQGAVAEIPCEAVMTGDESVAQTRELPGTGLAELAKKRSEKKLPPVDLTNLDTSFHPVVVIGVGETALHIVRHLRRRLEAQIGPRETLPSLQVLCLDSDRTALERVQQRYTDGRLESAEVLAVPLRSSAEYRSQKDLQLDWLSRRWIYNVPRSLQTEGLRPLGRLAFVDHHREIYNRLESLLEAVTESDAVNQTAQQLKFSQKSRVPRVVIVGSISGGIGSGMIPDLAYAVRTVLGELGYEEAELVGILTCAAGRPGTPRNVTVANACCCLSEIYHFSQIAGFPGDESCELPSYLDRTTFDSTYLVDMGPEPLPEQVEATADMIGEYLFLDAATRCGGYFAACRAADTSDDGALLIRTLGLSRSGGTNGDVFSLSIAMLGNSLTQAWTESQTETASGDRTDEFLVDLQQCYRSLHLDPAGLTARIATSIAERFGSDPGSVTRSRTEEIQAEVMNANRSFCGEELFASLEGWVDELLGERAVVGAQRLSVQLKNVLEDALQETVDVVAPQIKSAMLGQLDQPGSRIWRTERGIQLTRELLDSLASQLEKSRDVADADIANATHVIKSGFSQVDEKNVLRSDVIKSICQAVRTYGAARVSRYYIRAARRCVTMLLKRVQEINDSLAELRHAIERLGEGFQQGFAEEQRFISANRWSQSCLVSSLIMRRTDQRLNELTQRLDVQLQEVWQSDHGTISELLDQRTDRWTPSLQPVLRQLARQLLVQSLRGLTLDELFIDARLADEKIKRWLQNSLQTSIPHLLKMTGGNSRLLVAIPADSQSDLLATHLQDFAEDVPHFESVTEADVVMCMEVGGIPATQVAAMLMSQYPECLDLVYRVHTRSDINWAPIISLN
jgi:serine/threonine protein kinase